MDDPDAAARRLATRSNAASRGLRGVVELRGGAEAEALQHGHEVLREGQVCRDVVVPDEDLLPPVPVAVWPVEGGC